MGKMSPKERTNWIAKSGILAGVAILLMFFETPLPLMPVFLKFDLSEIPVMLAAFALGPVSAIIIEFIKNLAHLPFTGTGGVGEVANFFVGCALTVPAAVIYRNHKTKHIAILGMAVGTVVMTVFASLLNYYIMIPFYITVMGLPIEAIVGMSKEAGNKLVMDLKTLIVYVFVPFNIFKGLVASVLVALIYKPLSRLLHPQVCPPVNGEKKDE